LDDQNHPTTCSLLNVGDATRDSAMNRREVILRTVSALAANGLASAASAQTDYPNRPIKLIVPFAPGGVGDVTARLWAEKVRSLLGTVVVENQGGASGSIGASEVARAAPDGYTLLLGNTSTQILNPSLMPRPPYDPAKDFTVISIIGKSPIAIAINPSLPVKTLAELVAHIKSNPGKMTYGSAGTGTITNLAGEIFKQQAGVPDVTHIPYRGGGQSMTDVISGHIPMISVALTDYVVELHRTGKIRLIAVMTPGRVSILPDVSAATETYPNMIAAIFVGVFAPAATPKAIVDRIAQANRTAVSSDDFKNKLIAGGFEPVVDTPDEAQRYLQTESGRIVPLVKSLGFKLQ
jgi:tripartite-type tricarboxylate transporter receptor subunit TctC